MSETNTQVKLWQWWTEHEGFRMDGEAMMYGPEGQRLRTGPEIAAAMTRLKTVNVALLTALQEIHADTKGRGVWRPFFARIQRIARAALAVAEAKL